jgi:ferritin-like metal-binding protein YciE
MTDKNDLISMLIEALGMEKKTIEILEDRADRIRNHPEVVERFKKHIKETSWQIAQLENSVRQLGGEASLSGETGRNGIAEIGALLASGEVIRNSIANSAFERFEMAVYSRIAEAAELAGEHEISRICSTIQRQEETMAEWLEEHLATTPLVYLMFDEIHTQVTEGPPLPQAPAGPLS